MIISPAYSQENRVEQVFNGVPDAVKAKLNKFMNAGTQEAQDMISDFSEDELVNIKQIYENVLNKAEKNEKRFLWLYQAAEARKADKTASERLFYVALAVVLLMTLFSGFVGYLYFAQKKLISHFKD